jgi:hypothetical protein
MDKISIERIGGFAGFGLPGSRIRSRGEVDRAQLSGSDRKAVDALFAALPADNQPRPDEFRYRLTRHGDGGAQTIEVCERHVPESLRNCVQDELA